MTQQSQKYTWAALAFSDLNELSLAFKRYDACVFCLFFLFLMDLQ